MPLGFSVLLIPENPRQLMFLSNTGSK